MRGSRNTQAVISVPISAKEAKMGEDGYSLGANLGLLYRERIAASVRVGQGLLATEYELLAEHVAFLFDAIDLGRPPNEPLAY